MLDKKILTQLVPINALSSDHFERLADSAAPESSLSRARAEPEQSLSPTAVHPESDTRENGEKSA